MREKVIKGAREGGREGGSKGEGRQGRGRREMDREAHSLMRPLTQCLHQPQ